MNNIINGKIFKRSFFAIKVPAIVLLVISTIFSVIPIIMQYVNFQQNKITSSTFLNNQYLTLDNIGQFSLILFAYVFVAGFLLTYLSFNFLNKRKSSDFFHAIPQKRITLYISTLLSVVAWIFITITFVVGITTILYSVLGFNINFIQGLYVYFFFLVATLLVCGATALAMSTTGTTFTNIIAAGLFIFLPRLILLIAPFVVAIKSNIMPVSEMGFLLSPTYNIVTGMFTTSLFNIQIEQLMINLGGIIYSFILTLGYMALGAVVFVKRKSETAEKSAPNKLMQHIYRCAITFPFVLYVGMRIYQLITIDSTHSVFVGDNYTVTTILIVISLVVYFIYELITTKKAKNLLKAIPVYFILLAITGLFITAGHFYKITVADYIPLPEDIKSVSIQEKKDSYNGITSYEDVLSYSFDLQDDQLNRLVCNTLKSYNKNAYSNYDNNSVHFIKINLNNGKSIIRYIPVTNAINNCLDKAENAEYIEYIKKQPTDKEITLYSLKGMTDEEAKEIYNCLISEIKTLSLSETKRIVNNYNNSTKLDDNGNYSLTVLGNVKEKTFQNTYYINPNTTPKTFKLIYDINKSTYKNQIKMFKEKINQYKANGYSSGYIHLTNFNKDKITSCDLFLDDYLNNYNQELKKANALIEVLEKSASNDYNKIDENYSVLSINADLSKIDKNTGIGLGETFNIVVFVTNAQINQLKELGIEFKSVL